MPTDTGNAIIDSRRIAELTQTEERAFLAKRARSRELWKEATGTSRAACRILPGHAAAAGVHRPRQGSRVWDVDGNEYVDFHNGFGVMVVGHAHPAIVAAVEAQMHRGIAFRAAGRGEHRRRARAGPPVPSAAVALHQQRHRVRRSTRSAWRAGSPVASGSSRSRPRTTATTTRCSCRSSRRIDAMGDADFAELRADDRAASRVDRRR